LIRKATPSGRRIATGMARIIVALFSSTRTNSGLWNRCAYVAVPTHCDVSPSQLVKL
jgi:hypothetical protein